MATFNYAKLNGKISEIYGTQGSFAKAMGKSERTISMKLCGKIDFKQDEILKAVEILGIGAEEIPQYFFTSNVKDTLTS